MTDEIIKLIAYVTKDFLTFITTIVLIFVVGMVLAEIVGNFRLFTIYINKPNENNKDGEDDEVESTN